MLDKFVSTYIWLHGIYTKSILWSKETLSLGTPSAQGLYIPLHSIAAVILSSDIDLQRLEDALEDSLLTP